MFYLRNFKNFAEAELDFEQATTLIVGPNGAGKSNLIESVELLSFLAGGHRLHEITDLGREGAIEIRGGLEACAKAGEKSFTLGFRGMVVPIGGKQDEAVSVTYEITVRVGLEPRVSKEILKIEDRHIPIFEILEADEASSSADNEVRYDNNNRGKDKPMDSIAADRSALSQYARFAHKNTELSKTLALVDAVVAHLIAPVVCDPIPKMMRGYERRTETQLARNGYNISPVLFDLCTPRRVPIRDASGMIKMQHIDRSKEANRILKRIAQLPDEPFTGFEFFKIPKAGDVMFGFKSQAGEKPIDARVVSDGTLRALAILTALETSKAGTRLVLEEFDNGVHPSRVPVLAEALFDGANRNKLHVLATTHNPATLNALTTEQVRSVLLVIHDRAAGTARLLPLTDLPGHIEFIEGGRLGDLVTRRVYEQHLRKDYEVERQTEIEKWITALP